jgi:hypothetical protein
LSVPKSETTQHLAAAERNLDFAVRLLDDGVNLVTPPAYDWVLIIAFYAAVRYINAYHWQQFDSDPADHQARNGFVYLVSGLRTVAQSYVLLYTRSHIVRYQVGAPINAPAAQAAISIAERVRDTVRELL